MNFIPTTTSIGFSTSAWQALERAAVKRRSAATLLKLLSQFLQPVASSAVPDPSSTTPTSTSGLRLHVVPVSFRGTTPYAGDVSFEHWAALADAYAEEFLRMQRGDKGAREKAINLSYEMMRMNKAMECSA